MIVCTAGLVLVGVAHVLLIFITFPLFMLPPVAAFVANFSLVYGWGTLPEKSTRRRCITALIVSTIVTAIGFYAGMFWALNTYGS